MKHRHTIERVTTTEQRAIMRPFIDEYHSYINYADRPSRKMYYMLYEDGAHVGVFALSTVFDKPKAVSDYLKRYKLKSNEVANNIVYCLHGQQDKNAGSKFLSLIRRDAVNWWKERYGDELKAFQTFVLPPRNGAVYKADNWELIGVTSGSTQITKWVKKSELGQYPHAKPFNCKDGRTEYFIREYQETDKKLIFMKLVS